MAFRYQIFLILILQTSIVFGQTRLVEGTILENIERHPIPGANIRLVAQHDTTEQYRTATDSTGRFTVTIQRNILYFLDVSCIGYSPVRKSVGSGDARVNLGTLILTERIIPMGEVLIQGRIPTAVQRGDTTEYTAQAFKMNRDATAEDLVAKLPGVTVESGSVKVRGEDVQQVLVDGRPFLVRIRHSLCGIFRRRSLTKSRCVTISVIRHS